MGARFMANTINGSKGISNLRIKDDTEFSFDYKRNEKELEQIIVYAPTRDDYEVSLAVIDKALNKGCNVIVFDHWIFATSSGREYSGIQGIPIYSVPDFIKTIKSRKKLTNG